MTATSSSAPASEAARALELITQAAAILEPVRDDGDSDRHLRVLYAICATWDEPCDSEDWESIIPRTHNGGTR